MEKIHSYFTRVQDHIDKYSKDTALNEFLHSYPAIYKLFNRGQKSDQYAYKHPLDTGSIYALHEKYGPSFIEDGLKLVDHMKENLGNLKTNLLEAATPGSEADRGDKIKVQSFNNILAPFGYGIRELNKEKSTKNKLVGDRGMQIQVEAMAEKQRMIPIVTHESPEELLQPGSIFSAYGMLHKNYNNFESIDTRINDIIASIRKQLDQRENELSSYQTPEVIDETKAGLTDIFAKEE